MTFYSLHFVDDEYFRTVLKENPQKRTTVVIIIVKQESSEKEGNLIKNPFWYNGTTPVGAK